MSRSSYEDIFCYGLIWRSVVKGILHCSAYIFLWHMNFSVSYYILIIKIKIIKNRVRVSEVDMSGMINHV